MVRGLHGGKGLHGEGTAWRRDYMVRGLSDEKGLHVEGTKW